MEEYFISQNALIMFIYFLIKIQWIPFPLISIQFLWGVANSIINHTHEFKGSQIFNSEFCTTQTNTWMWSFAFVATASYMAYTKTMSTRKQTEHFMCSKKMWQNLSSSQRRPTDTASFINIQCLRCSYRIVFSRPLSLSVCLLYVLY